VDGAEASFYFEKRVVFGVLFYVENSFLHVNVLDTWLWNIDPNEG
jgi:hypothetical protein